MHGVLHIVDYCEIFSCSLKKLSAFEFEIFLGSIRARVKKNKNPMGQVAKTIKMKQHKWFDKSVDHRSHHLRLSADLKNRYIMTDSGRLQQSGIVEIVETKCFTVVHHFVRYY